MNKKIKMLVIPSDKSGCGKFRSVDPHVYIAEHYGDEFDIDITPVDIVPENFNSAEAMWEMIQRLQD